jgi:hypothetical protein
MNSTDSSFDKIRDEIISCIKENNYELIKSKDLYIIDELLEHFNSVQTSDDILFKTCINKNIDDNRSNVKTSPVIKGDYIKLEEINLYNVFNNNNNFTQRFSEL